MVYRILAFFAVLIFLPKVGHASIAEYGCYQSNNSRIENVKVTTEIVGDRLRPVAISYDVVTFSAKLANVYKSMLLGPDLAGNPTVYPQSYKILESRETYLIKPVQPADIPRSQVDRRKGTIFQGNLRTDGAFEWFSAQLPIGTNPYTFDSISMDEGEIQVHCVRLESSPPRTSVCEHNGNAC